MSTTTKGTCRTCGATVQADRTLCKPGYGCRKAAGGARTPAQAAHIQELQREAGTAPQAPALPVTTPLAITPKLTAIMASAGFTEELAEGLFESLGNVLAEPCPGRLRAFTVKFEKALDDVLIAALTAAYGAGEARLYGLYGARYRLPEQRAWMRRYEHYEGVPKKKKFTGTGTWTSEVPPRFWENEAEWVLRAQAALGAAPVPRDAPVKLAKAVTKKRGN